MVSSKEIIFKLLKSSLLGEISPFSPENVNWTEVIELALGQGVGAITFDGVQKLPKDKLPDIDSLMEWLGQAEFLTTTWEAQLQSAKELAELWYSKGIRTIVLKGFAFAKNYPNPNHRPSNDLDCYLCGKYDEGNTIIESKDIEIHKEDYRHSTFQYGDVHVENHKICTTVRGKKQRKVFERYLRELLEKERTNFINGSRLEIPCELFNALYFLQHAHRHFLREGITIRYICDWAMMIKCYTCFDDKFWNICSDNDLKPFADSMTRLAFYTCGVKAPWLKLNIIHLLSQDEMLLNDCFAISDNAIKYGNDFKAHFQMVKNMIAQRWKYKYFSEDSFLWDILTSVWAVFFEKNPEV